MTKFVAKRIRFRNGERHSVLQVPGGLPVHEATLFLSRFRRKGRAANTIQFVCVVLAFLYRELDKAGVNLMERLEQGRFLTYPELERLASAAQYRVDDLSEDEGPRNSTVVRMARIRLRIREREQQQLVPVDIATQATRLRYMAEHLEFVSDYVGAGLPERQRKELEQESAAALKAFRAHIPPVSKRAKLNARMGLSEDEQRRLVQFVHPDSPANPWVGQYVRLRNWVIVVVLLATGMRRGELLGLQIRDIHAQQPRLQILRRADAIEDPRPNQPVPKTYDREVELSPSIMKVLWSYINKDRQKIKAARAFPQIFVSDEGDPLSHSSIDKLFVQLRQACPGLPVRLTSHVMRHTWNERFSEQAEALGLSQAVEEKARNSQQGWSDNSKTSATYTRRHDERKGREVSLMLQEKLDAELKPKE
jgi:integrase